MRSTRMGALTALLGLGLTVGACGSKDATGPTISLSLEEVYGLAGELADAMSSMNVGLRVGGGPLLSALPGRSISAATPINGTVGCAGGGTVAATGSYDSTTALTADVTLTFTGCKTAHYVTSGTLRATGTVTSTPTSASGQATLEGTLAVTTLDGRSGACDVKIAATGSGSQVGAPAITLTGTACGADISGAY